MLQYKVVSVVMQQSNLLIIEKDGLLKLGTGIAGLKEDNRFHFLAKVARLQ